MAQVNKNVELLGYAKVRFGDAKPYNAKILSDSTCWLEDGRVLTLPPEELSRFARQMENKKKDDGLAANSYNIMAAPSPAERKYEDEDEIAERKRIAEAQKRAKMVAERNRRMMIEKKKAEERKNKKNNIIVAVAVVVIAAAVFGLWKLGAAREIVPGTSSVSQVASGESLPSSDVSQLLSDDVVSSASE